MAAQPIDRETDTAEKWITSEMEVSENTSLKSRESDGKLDSATVSSRRPSSTSTSHDDADLCPRPSSPINKNMFHLGSAYENDGSTMARSKEDEVANEKEDGSDGEERRNGPGRNNKFVKKFELQITRRKELTGQQGNGVGWWGFVIRNDLGS